MQRDLDLERSIRPGLDILANEIVIALKKRTRFLRNPEIYVPGLVRTEPGTSLLDYELARIEQVHAELGRYTFADQEPFTDVDGVSPIIDREMPASPIEPVPSRIGARVLSFYQQWIAEACAPGTDSDTFGETVTADVTALLCIMERINLGKFVAESKLEADPDAFRATAGEREALLALIVKKDREEKVFELARRLAEHYELEERLAVSVFEWMIGTTIDVEVDYLRVRLGYAGA